MTAKLIALVLPLGLDTFAVSAALGALGTLGTDRRRRLRISLLFAGFEAGMPLIGLGLGAPLGHAIGGAADYVAVGVLIGFGLYTLFGADEDETRLRRLLDPRGAAALLLGVGISLDELAVGFSLGLLRLPVVLVIVLVGTQAFIVTQLGLRLGGRLSEQVREGAERLAGVALTGLGVVLLVEKLL